MARILITFLGQRILLFCVAIFVLHYGMQQSTKKDTSFSFSKVYKSFLSRVSGRAEARRLLVQVQKPQRLSWSDPPNPFLSLARMVRAITGFRPLYSMIFLANLFFIFFLIELYLVLSRFVPPHTAAKAAALVVLLPTSFELSLVSSFSLTCFLLTVIVRRILDNHWLVAGILYAVLILLEPVVIAMLPLFIYIFVYYQRHFYVSMVVRRAAFFVLPAVLAIAWNWDGFKGLGDVFSSSSWYYLYSSFSGAEGVTRTLLHSPFSTVIVLLLLLGGGITAALYNTSIVYKITPLYMFGFLIFSSSYEELTARAALAGLCMEGVALVSGRTAIISVHLVLLALGMFEAGWTFR